jgi:hypothetical protein
VSDPEAANEGGLFVPALPRNTPAPRERLEHNLTAAIAPFGGERKAAPMAHARENPDRNFSADGEAEESFEALRDMFDHSEPALPFNEAAKVRIGKMISDAVLPSCIRAPARRLAGKRDGAL